MPLWGGDVADVRHALGELPTYDTLSVVSIYHTRSTLQKLKDVGRHFVLNLGVDTTSSGVGTDLETDELRAFGREFWGPEKYVELAYAWLGGDHPEAQSRAERHA